MSPPTQSDIWNYFKPNKEDHEKADCQICNKSYSRKGRTTTSLKNHLKSMHPMEFSEYEDMSREKQLLQMIKSESDIDITDTSLQEVNSEDFFEEIGENKSGTCNISSNKIDQLIGEMIALQNLPFDFVEGAGFRRLIQELAPTYKCKGSIFFNEFVYKELYEKVVQKVKDQIEKFDYMSFTADIWSDPNSNASLLSITCHGIAENFDRSSFVLKCETFDSSSVTDDIISEKFNTILSEWNIKKEQVHCLIRDEGSKMKRAGRLATMNDIDCPLVKMEMVIRSFSNTQENLKLLNQKLKKMFSHLNNFDTAQKEVQTTQDCLNQHQIKESNNKYSIFENFLRAKNVLSFKVDDSEICILSEEWKMVESLIKLLKSFREAKRELSSSHDLISSVIPIIHMLEKTIDDNLTRSPDEFESIREAVNALKSEMSTQFSSLRMNNLYIIATYLDPRYKHKFCTSVTELKIKEDILIMINSRNGVSDAFEGISQRAKRMRMAEMDDEQPSGSGLIRKTSLKNDLALLLGLSSDDESCEIPANDSTDTVLKKEMLTYRNKKRIKLDEDPLKWWSVHRGEFKLLSTIARRFLSAPLGSFPSETLRSSADIPCQNLSSRLETEKAAKLHFIKYNAPKFNFSY